MFLMIFKFAKFRAVPPFFAIVAFYRRFLFTATAFFVLSDLLLLFLFFGFLQYALEISDEVEWEG